MTKKISAPSSQYTLYTFTGPGLCVPGLPHVVTPAQAAELGLLDQLQAAIESGAYQPQEPTAPEIHEQEQ